MPLKSTSAAEVGRRKEKSKRNYRSQSIRIINVFLESLLSGSFPSLGVTVHLTLLGYLPTLLVSGPAVGAGQILIWSSVYSCLLCPQLSEFVCFLLWELSVSFYIFRRCRVCLVDRVDFICSLHSWWEGFGSSSLATLPLGFICGFISTSACG